MQALERTSTLGLSSGIPLTFLHKDCIDIEVLTPVLQRLLGGYTEEQIAFQCIRINHELRPRLEGQLGVPLYLTFGWYEHLGKKVYQHDDQLLASLLHGGVADVRSSGYPFHCWLTTPAHEVLDVTLNTSIAAVSPKNRHLVGGVHYFSRSHPTPEIIFHPTVVGENFLLRFHERAIP